MITPSWHPPRHELRTFGIVAFFVFGVLGLALRFHFGHPVAAWVVWGIGTFAGVMGLAAPFQLYLLYLVVTVVALPIGLVVSNVVLGVIYFGIMTPLGWVMRLSGRDPLRLRKPAVESFWIPRTHKRDPASYYRQS
ncbi:MAG: hypothetical protein KDB80_10880 [Planctomycetes bacterium]|nr:hypothetical protein [Planctomycetota bacterium]